MHVKRDRRGDRASRGDRAGLSCDGVGGWTAVVRAVTVVLHDWSF